MSKYEIYEEDNSIDVFGYDQCFTKEDIKSLWAEHKILYRQGGVMAVWIEERDNINPLVHLMEEDDGHIYWRKEKDVCFDSGWLDNYINTMEDVKKLVK